MLDICGFKVVLELGQKILDTKLNMARALYQYNRLHGQVVNNFLMEMFPLRLPGASKVYDV